VPETGCVRFQGPHNEHGYGIYHRGGGREYAHRHYWEEAHGPIPAGLVLDHVLDRGCIFRDCINLEHLELVTQDENARRGRRQREQRGRTHCPKKHAYTEANTMWRVGPNGGLKRDCRTCTYIRNAKNRAKRKEKP
jgi:hypothetical protein